MDGDVLAAVSRSHLRDLSDELVGRLVADAVSLEIPAGSVLHWAGESAPHLELVVSGLVRVFVTAGDGRTMTVRYCRSGALLGVMTLFASGFSLPATIQALADARVLRMSPAAAVRCAAHDPRVAAAFLTELSERAMSFLNELPGSAFSTVRQRIARHLLDLAAEHLDGSGASVPRDQHLVVPVPQRELADAVGTVREVVVRELRELRSEGVVRTERDRIIITDPARLIQAQGWNPGH